MFKKIYLEPDEDKRPWTPLAPKEVSALLAHAKFPWWIAGGYAIEYFVGQSFRKHEDIDILILRKDLNGIYSLLSEWQLCASDPPGKLRYWAGEELSKSVHDIWVRKDSTAPWALQIMINDSFEDSFVYKRDSKVQFSIAEHTVAAVDGLSFVSPEFQLIHKAKSLRPKDEEDFAQCIAKMDSDRLLYLKNQIAELYSDQHPWCLILAEGLEVKI